MLQTMLSDAKLIQQINNILCNKNKCDEFINLIAHYSTGKWIYPGVIQRKLQIDVSTTYNLLKILEKLNILDSYYEVSCSNCQHTTGQIYNAINELPDFYDCELCHQTINSFESAMLIYKVVV